MPYQVFLACKRDLGLHYGLKRFRLVSKPDIEAERINNFTVDCKMSKLTRGLSPKRTVRNFQTVHKKECVFMN